MVAIATCNYPETAPDCNGGSSVFDGVAYLPELEGSRDMCILQAGGAEGIYMGGAQPHPASSLPPAGNLWKCLPAPPKNMGFWWTQTSKSPL